MKKYKSDFFGEIDLEKDEDYYDVEYKYENRIIELDLNIYLEEKPRIEQLIQIDNIIKNLSSLEKEIRKFIDSDFEADGISKEYVEFYTDEFEEYELDSLVDKENKEKTIEEQLLSKIYIRRIGFYPNDNQFAVFDFHVNHEISDQILVVIIENDMSYDIRWES